ncbi:MAG: GNAT family N-acetyltransferase [Clostridium sp.]|nr:GNAT family N-acetyltransferase [Clostridium sp.]
MTNIKGCYRRNGKYVYIKQPEYDDLAFVSKLWSDEETMKDIGGVFDFPESKWEMFYKKMVYPTDGKNFYCLVYTINNEAIGEVSFHGYDLVTKIARFNVKIHYKYRNKGYGEEALKLLLEYFFLDFGGGMIIDSVPTESAIKIAKNLGFKEIGQYKDGMKMKITSEDFFNKEDSITKNIGILMYDGMRMLDYATAFDTLKIVNILEEKEIFNVRSIALKNKIKLKNGLVVDTEVSNLNIFKPDILIIPDGDIGKNKEIQDIIINDFNHYDYICTKGEGINFLSHCGVLEGIRVPRLPYGVYDKDVVDERNIIDSGKIILSANVLGSFEMILSLVQKVAGREVSKRLEKHLGYNSENF